MWWKNSSLWLFIFLFSHDSQDIAAETVKKRRRATKKPYSRSIVGATLEIIQKKRAEKPEVRDAAREAALRYASFPSIKLPLLQLGGGKDNKMSFKYKKEKTHHLSPRGGARKLCMGGPWLTWIS